MDQVAYWDCESQSIKLYEEPEEMMDKQYLAGMRKGKRDKTHGIYNDALYLGCTKYNQGYRAGYSS